MIKLKGSGIFIRPGTIFTVLALFICSAASAQTNPADDASLIQNRMTSVYADNKDCVVKVTSIKWGEDGKAPKVSCTGFISSKDGHVITSAIATYKSSRIVVEWKGVELEAEEVGFDPMTTLAVLKIKNTATAAKMPFVKFDSMSKIPCLASPLILISRELGFPASPRFGLVAGHDINFGDTFLPAVYLRTDIPAYAGSIGSPAFDFDGNFVGMQVVSLEDTNGSFLMPAKAVARIRDDVLLCKEPVYGWFGLRATDNSDSEKSYVCVDFVIKGSPADKAGFKVGDIIREINGADIENNVQLRNITFYVRPGETVRFKVLRGTEKLNLELLVEKMDSEVIRASTEKLEPKTEPKDKQVSADSTELSSAGK